MSLQHLAETTSSSARLRAARLRDHYAISITDMDFSEGSLHKQSNVRPNRLFSASTSLVLYQAGRLNDQAVTSVITRIIDILQAG
ncbi:hypothetical protein BN140_1019 [Methanoculleus bourgensis MS2]|uniref:Uncharacterized protein n=2 Tax=Methanoculleus bourgensis TaxID=83986 RepID=I7LJG0_METBM|nr:hypothetical protein BN140_1019 [Methanoculleus bourgensis MS2]